MSTQEETPLDNPYEAPHSEVSLVEEAQVYKGKVYNPLAIAISTLFGSVLAAGLLLYSNFTHFNQKPHAISTVVVTIIATILFLFASLSMEHPSSLMYLMFNFIIAVIMFPLTMTFQGTDLDAHEDADRPFHSVFRAIAIGIGCFLAMGVMLFLAFSMFLIFRA